MTREVWPRIKQRLICLREYLHLARQSVVDDGSSYENNPVLNQWARQLTFILADQCYLLAYYPVITHRKYEQPSNLYDRVYISSLCFLIHYAEIVSNTIYQTHPRIWTNNNPPYHALMVVLVSMHSWIKISTPYISFTSSADALRKLADWRRGAGRRGDQKVVVIDPRTRFDLELPILQYKSEVDFYQVEVYTRAYLDDHYLCLWEVTPEEVVGVWDWEELRARDDWYEQVLVPAVARYRRARLGARVQIQRGRGPHRTHDSASDSVSALNGPEESDDGTADIIRDVASISLR